MATPQDNDRPLVEFHEVTYALNHSKPESRNSKPAAQTIIDHLNLAITRGETMVLLGESGCGKTTTLRLVNNLLTPTSGRVMVEGKATSEWDVIRLRRRTGYVIQEAGLFPHFTVEQNVALVPNLEGWDDERVRARVREMLLLVGLDAQKFADRYPRELSGGQRQRVGVARALAADPPLLLMDEPFGALDPVTRAELHREFRRIQSELRKTVVIVTHDMAEAFALAPRVGVLDGGVIAQIDEPRRLARSTDPRVRPLLEP